MSQLRGSTGTLIVIIARARGLPNKRKLEKQNPYCLLRLANLTDKTKADIRGGQVPRWDAEFRFHLTSDCAPILKLSVLDETKKAPTLIAETEIDFTPVFYASVKEGYDKWHQLQAGDGTEAGEIYIEMTFYPASGSTTFTQSGRKMGSSVASMSMSSRAGKRRLPPIPGQEEPEPEPVDESAIPPPLPRNPVGFERVPFEQSFRQSMNASQMSVHSLPDIPRQRLSDLPVRTTAASPPLIDRDEYVPYKPSSSLPLISNREQSDDRIPSSSTNAFDELEREVQLNFDGPPVRQHRSKPRPPPVPSHSVSLRSSGSSTGSGTHMPVIPPANDSVYDVIEPVRETQSAGRRSPQRKPPTNFYKSGSTSPVRLDLASIPYDAKGVTAGQTSPTTRKGFGERLHTKDSSDVLLEKHNAPTPYDLFVGQAKNSTGSSESMGSSGGRSRMSPSRFKSSLPPLPPR